MKKKITRSPTLYRDAVFLALCSQTEATMWLQNRPMRLSSVMGIPNTPDDSHILEYILLRRRNSAIDLALAEQGRSGTVLRRLYIRSSDAIKVVACSNASLFTGDTISNRWRERSLIWMIIFDGPMAEVRAVCENPHMSSGVYTALISCWKPENEQEEGKRYLSEDRYLSVLSFLANNPRVTQAREESAERNYLDGFADYEYNKFYTLAWTLAETAPTTSVWAYTLSSLFNRLHVPFDCVEDIEATIERWRPDHEHDHAPTRGVRRALAMAFMTPSLSMLNHYDEAIRSAFYQSFDPNRKEFTELDWNEWIDRDEQIYFDICRNDKVWSSSVGRSKLNDMLWHGARKDNDLLNVGFYREHVERIRSSNPGWFADSEQQDLSAPVHDPITDLRQEIRSLILVIDQRRRSGLWIAIVVALGIVVGLVLK